MKSIHSVFVVDTNQRSDLLTQREFVWPLQRTLSVPSKVISFSKLTPKSILGFDAIIFSGCTLKDNAYLKRVANVAWLKSADVPMLGICAGAHILGHLFGAKISKQKKPSIGVHPIRITKENPFFRDIPFTFNVYSLHGNQVSLPKDFITIASSKETKNEIIVHNSRPVVGVSFHPEVLNKSFFSDFLRWASEHTRAN